MSRPMQFGSQSEVGKIESILLKHPRDAFVSQKHVDAQWRELNYHDRPNYDRALEEYDRFVELLKNEVQEIHFLPRHKNTGLDSIYMHDPVVITNGGAILCNMGKQARRREPAAVGEFLTGPDVPILGEITDPGRLEGGDIVWLDERTLAMGQGYRTNDEGIRQVKELTADLVDDLIVVPLPHWTGPEGVFHIMSFISPVDKDLAVVYSPLMPVFFRKMLLERGIELIEVPDDEYRSMACNVLAVAPRKCVMVEGNPRTRELLEKAGASVVVYQGNEISRKGAGGPTCLTRPLLRSAP